MLTKELVDRINELSRKQHSIGLSEEEKTEQEKLRRVYLDGFRANLKAQLDNIRIMTHEEYEEYQQSLMSESGCEASCELGCASGRESDCPHSCESGCASGSESACEPGCKPGCTCDKH